MDKMAEERIIERIKEALAADPEKTQTGLAEAMGGLSHSAVSRMLKGERRIKAAELPAIEDYLGVSVAEVTISSHDRVTRAEALQKRTEGARSAEAPLSGAVDLPIRGAGVAGRTVYVEDHRFGFTERPDDLIGVDGAYSVLLPDDTLGDIFIGARIIIDPRLPVRPGKLVVIIFNEQERTDGRPWICRKLVSRNPDGSVVTQQQFPERTDVIEASAIHKIDVVHSIRLG